MTPLGDSIGAVSTQEQLQDQVIRIEHLYHRKKKIIERIHIEHKKAIVTVLLPLPSLHCSWWPWKPSTTLAFEIRLGRFVVRGRVGSRFVVHDAPE